MKQIKLYICTYQNPEALNRNLETLFASDLMRYDHSIHIINNHSKFELNPKFQGKVEVLHNMVRPDFSTGHLSRTWNQALLNGFQNLNNPDCKFLMLSQDDVLYEPDFCSKVMAMHRRFDLIHWGLGDMFISHTPQSLKQIGIFDERYAGIGYQEFDYFLRAVLCHGDYFTLNDGERTWNPLPPDTNLCRRTKEGYNFYSENQMHCLGRQVFVRKWIDQDIRWSHDNPPLHSSKPDIPTWLTYQYFEKDIEDLEGKGYICDFADSRHYM